jgi:hypothetical protein
MSEINLNILEEILLNINYDNLDKIINVHGSIDQLTESILYWKNQHRIFFGELFGGIFFDNSTIIMKNLQFNALTFLNLLKNK